MTLAIMVHGGASAVPEEEAEAYRHGCLAAVRSGWAVLERGGNACDAVEAAIGVFEGDETFNAARGAALNAHGEVGWAHDSTDMSCAVMTSTMGQPWIWLRKTDQH